MQVLVLGIYLIVFCLPLYLVRFKIFSIPTTALELLIYGLFVLWLIKGGYKNLQKIIKDNKGLIWPIILILIGVTISTIFSWDLRVSAGIWKAWFVDPLMFFIVFISTIKKDDLKNVFKALILSGFVVSIISLVYLIQGNLNFQGRLQGIYDSPNFLSMYLAPILIISLAKIIKKIYLPARRTSWQTNLFIILSCLLLIVVLFFTKSFGAWMGILGALALGLFTNWTYRTDKSYMSYLLVLIFLIFAIVFVLGMIKINSLEGLRSFDARFVIWQKAWQVFKQYPLIGIGPGTFQDYFPLYPKWGVPQPHNLFLAFLLQTGIIGFIGFIWLILYFFKNSIKLFTTQYSLLIITIMSYILIHGLVDTTYWKNDLSMVFWLMIGIMAVIKKEP